MVSTFKPDDRVSVKPSAANSFTREWYLRLRNGRQGTVIAILTVGLATKVRVLWDHHGSGCVSDAAWLLDMYPEEIELA